MANEGNKVDRWLTLQRVTWQADEGAKATRVVMLDRDNEQVAEFALTTPNLSTVIGDVLDMQADELPHGAHSFRLVAYDDQKKQLGELRQTIRGRNKDATSAAQEAISRENAAAKSLSNSAEVQRQQHALNQQLVEHLDNERDNTNQLLDALRQIKDSNFESELRLREFDKRQERIDQALEVVGDLLKLVAPVLIQKFLPGMPIPGLPSQQQSPQEPTEQPQSGTTEKPADTPSASVAQPGSEVLHGSAESRGKGNGGSDPAKHRRETASTSRAKRPQPKGRKKA